MRAMRRVNIADPPFSYDPDDIEGFRSGAFQPGFGAQRCGVSVYEVPPGESICPYHYEYGEEEWLFVLEGRPLLRAPEGTERLEPSDLVFFPMGPEGAHQVRNDTDSTVRVVMWSNIVVPSATAYPDSDKVGIWTGVEGESLITPRSSQVGYYHGEGG
jgi:uncharacterized cupin superfamily protein